MKASEKCTPIKKVKKALPDTPHEWIQKLGMEKYWKVLEKSGFDTYPTLACLNEQALDRLGVVIDGHRTLLLTKSRELSDLN
jgi:hypothetical protein